MHDNKNSFGESKRDIFLSHRSIDHDFVYGLAADIEKEIFQNRGLSTWVDEAEIRPGQSVPGMINLGIESSHFIGIVMTPSYFVSESGWTDAEWHAAIHIDPDNRQSRIIPILAYSCPYIPVLLRHLRMIDFRGNKYPQGLKELLAVLKNEPLPRPVTYKGQLIQSDGRVNRGTLFTERAVLQADPDVVNERLHCNLLPVEQIPQNVYVAPIAKALRKKRNGGTEALPSKQEIKEEIRISQEKANIEYTFMPAFRVSEDKIVTFHDLESLDGSLSSVVEDTDVEIFSTAEFLQDEDDRKIIISLLNMAIDRYVRHLGLIIDDTKQGRFFFPPKDGGANSITWIPKKRKASRTVAKPYIDDNAQVKFWRHLGAYIRMIFIANRFYLKIIPTWVITEDGTMVKGGTKVGKLIIKWTGAERNLQVLYHVRFWTCVLRNNKPGPISIRAGDQYIEFSTVPAFIQQSYGIAYDNRDLMGLLDQEAVLIAEEEDRLADRAAEVEVNQELENIEDIDEDELIIDIDEEFDLDDIE